MDRFSSTHKIGIQLFVNLSVVALDFIFCLHYLLLIYKYIGQLRIQVDMKSVATVTKLQDFSITLSTAPPLLPQRRENHEETTKIDLNETQSGT